MRTRSGRGWIGYRSGVFANSPPGSTPTFLKSRIEAVRRRPRGPVRFPVVSVGAMTTRNKFVMGYPLRTDPPLTIQTGGEEETLPDFLLHSLFAPIGVKIPHSGCLEGSSTPVEITCRGQFLSRRQDSWFALWRHGRGFEGFGKVPLMDNGRG